MSSMSQSEPKVVPTPSSVEIGTQNGTKELRESVAQPSFSWRRWALPVASTILVPILLLGIVEVVLRAFDVGFPTSLTQPCTIKGQPANCYNLFFVAPFFPPGMIKEPQVYAIPAIKPPGTYRIFVLGESAAMGDPDPAYGFSRYLEVMLRERYPAMKFEVANTGSVAINSHVSLSIGEGLARFQPDVIILYSGNNEVVGPYGPGTALTSSGMLLPVIRASIFARSTRIGQLLTKLGTPRKEWGGMEMFMGKQVPASSPLLPQTYSNFESNLRDTVDVAQHAGARVLISTVATNLRDCAPFASLHRADLSAEDLRSWTALVEKGSAAENAHSNADALNSYLAAERIDNQYAELEFRIARSMWMLGDYAGSKEHFERARDLDTLRFRADSKINEINRSVANAKGAELLDADSLFAKESPNGVVGSEFVYEHVHLTPEGNYLLARAMFLQIASRIPADAGRPALNDDVPSQAECERRLALTGYDRTQIAGEMFQRLQSPPFTNQINHADQVLRLTMKAEGATETPNETAAKYQWAIAQKPDDRILHGKFGAFLFNFDRAAAAAELKRAQPWDGFPVFAPDGTPIQ
jgi:tetratricopeptide (TPR) repeat protein